MIHYQFLARLLVLLILANGAPVIAKRIFGDRFARALDAGATLSDGQPVFGSSKTIRGIISSLAVTTAGALLLGLRPEVGTLIAAAAMAGDLLSSFTKRRLGLPPSSRALGLDQIPESLLPLLVCSLTVPLSAADIFLGTALFLVGELLLSRILFELHVRDRPY